MIEGEMSFKAKETVRSPSKLPPNSHMRVFLLCVLFLPAFFLTVSEAFCNLQDRETLLWFYGNISSSISPLNWNSSIDCCSWEGITCDDSSDRHVTAISLPSRGLSGHLHSSVQNLHRLSHLDLSSNLLQGEIFNDSTVIQGAMNLISFNVSNNSFTGPIPSFMCTSATRLRKLDFSYNEFTGLIPQGLGRCLRLTILRAGFNNLSGEIPRDIYNLSELEQLFLPVNHLSGKIHDDITMLKKLTSLELYYNHLVGDIPMGIGHLSNLRSLQLYINNLTGSVPLTLANCTNLVKLNLRVNRLGGTLSDFDFSQLQNLSILDLGNNNFTGDLPDTVFFCKSLTAIRFAGNRLTGQIPPQVRELESMSFLSFSDNHITNITGALSILQGCKKLSTLLMAKNFYDETVPSNEDLISPGGFPKLQILSIGGCRLKGEIPAWLMKLKSLQVLGLSLNRFKGSIPGWLGTLPNLFYIDLSDNLLSGELPKEFFYMRALMSQKAYDATEMNYLELPVFVGPNNISTNQQYNQLSSLPPAIYMRRNYLTGSIPVEVGQLKVVHVIELLGNNLSGSIPDEVSNLTNLERLDLSNNNLSGRIPVSLTSLHFLSYFNVANNNLEGPIPTGLFDTFKNAYFEGNPLLCGGVLPLSCRPPVNKEEDTRDDEDDEDDEEVKITFLIGVAVGFFISYCFYWYHFAMRLVKD